MLGRDDYVASENISMRDGRDWPDPSPVARVARFVLTPINAFPGRVRSKLSSFRQYVEDQNRHLLQLTKGNDHHDANAPNQPLPTITGQESWKDVYHASFTAKFGALDLFNEVMGVISPTERWL